MKVKDLIKKLENCDPELPVLLSQDPRRGKRAWPVAWAGEYRFSMREHRCYQTERFDSKGEGTAPVFILLSKQKVTPRILKVEKSDCGKWVEFWYEGRLHDHHWVDCCKSYMLNDRIQEKGLENYVLNKGYVGLRLRWVYRAPNWELDEVLLPTEKVDIELEE
jgi:hypothetical protein